jgi:hypothetical protein
LIGLAAATITLAGLQLHWVPATETHQVAIVLVVFSAPVQLIASVLTFLARDAPTATATGVQAATWLTAGVILETSPPGARSQVLGLLLFLAAAGVSISAISASLGKLVVGLMLATTALRFVLTGVYEYAGGDRWEAVAGWVGLVLGVLALYTACAAELGDQCDRPVFPLLRRGRGRRAVVGGMEDATAQLAREPGVRRQL